MSDHARDYRVTSNWGKRPARPPKPKGWSHQEDLQAKIGSQITVDFHDGGNHSGRLLATDQFTLKVETTVSGKTYTITVFKNYIASYCFIEA